MSRLIDADALMETIKKDFSSKFLNVKQFDNGSKSFMECFIETVKSVPTAYDLDKVVAELEELDKKTFRISPKDAIEIVRMGGVE